MLKYLQSSNFLNRLLLNHEAAGVKESRESEAEGKLVYRDELSKKRACYKKQERSIDNEVGKESSKIRVKVRMTKTEAERLLAKCKQGGVLEFRDVARELVQIPAGRVDVLSPGEDGSQLQSIPEE